MPRWIHINGSKEWHHCLVYCRESAVCILRCTCLWATSVFLFLLQCFVVTGYVPCSLTVSDLSRFLQFLCQYRYLYKYRYYIFFSTQCSRLNISARVESWGSNGTLKVISFSCSVPTLYFSGMLRKGCVLSDTFPWTGYIIKELLVPLLLYFELVDMLCWHFACSRDSFKNILLPCYQFFNNGILVM